jgi:Tol biopolymer transport system component
MTGHDDFDRTLAGWFESDAQSPVPPDGLDRVLDATRRRWPRPAWLADLGSHWVGEALDGGSSSGVHMLPRLGLRRSTTLILLLVLAALVGGAILVGARLPQPTPLPLGHLGHLAYARDGNIYMADWDGRNPVLVADGPPGGCSEGDYWAEGLMWSPDGGHLAYRSDVDQGSCPSFGGTVILSDPDGHVIASFPGTGWLVSWSPDSTRVATWVDSRSIGVVGLDGGRQSLLTLPEGMTVPGDYDPYWSPDGRSLLIYLSPPSPSEVWELPVDGGTPRRVPADDPRSNRETAYSADGSRVAYVSSDSHAPGHSLVVAAADGSQAQTLVSADPAATQRPCDVDGVGVVDDLCPPEGSMTEPVMSPTGDRVAFTTLTSIRGGGDLNADLRLVDVATRSVRVLATGHSNDLRAIAFSPEGDRILFWRGAALWSVDVDGTHPQQLVAEAGAGDWQRLPSGS